MVMIAKTANPDLFTDVDLDDMQQMLTEEATGTLPTGSYYYEEAIQSIARISPLLSNTFMI